MTILLNSLLPIFIIILVGAGLRRIRIVSDEAWQGMERITYYVFLPVMLVQTLYKADFSEFAATSLAAGLFTGAMIMLAAMLIVRPLLQPVLGITSASYSSLYQATTRFNGFVALAIAAELAGQKGLTIVAIALGVMVVPINVVNIPVVAALGKAEGQTSNPVLQVIRNPMIIGVFTGLALHFSGFNLPKPVDTTFELLTRIALPFGLLLVGAGLRVRLPGAAIATVAVGTTIKLLIMPVLLGLCVWAFGVRGEELVIATLCGAGPAAMNGFLVARELGGDAPLFAATVTAQTVIAFITIPIVIAVAGMVG